MDWLIAFGSSLIGLALLGIIGWLYYRRKNPKPQKTLGAKEKKGAAVSVLKSFAKVNKYKFIAPATLARNAAYADLDAIVIGYFGVLALKAYGYNGEIYGSANDEQWLQVNENNRNYFSNPISQAAADMRVIRDALIAGKLRQLPVEVVCVFTNKKAQLAIPRSTGHLTVKELKALLRKDKYYTDTGVDLDAAETAIRNALVQNS